MIPFSNTAFNKPAVKSPRHLPVFIILEIYIFNSSKLTDELTKKALQSLITYLLVSNNLFGKLVPSLELQTIFDHILKVFSFDFLLLLILVF